MENSREGGFFVKKKKWLLIGGGILVLAVAAVVSLYLIFWRTKNEPMPTIVFYYYDYEVKWFYISADGNIYASKLKGDNDFIAIDEITNKVQQNDYGDILELVGVTDPKKVKKMYNLFVKVVIQGDYWLEPVHKAVPNGLGSDSRHRVLGYWAGIYKEPDGQLIIRRIFSTSEEYTCSDQRGYQLVEWMDKTLDEYTKIK